jgi:hypothetical protein
VNVEWELDATGQRTGQWRRRQSYARVDDERVPSARTPCEWRTGVPAPEPPRGKKPTGYAVRDD